MVELDNWKTRIEQLGINVAAMTYDSGEVISKFREEKQLSYTLLRDENAKHVNAYGIRNETYGPGELGYGVPHPGILYINENGIVKKKFASRGFKKRPSFEAIYSTLKALKSSPR